MNTDIILDLLRVLKVNKSYKQYSNLRFAGKSVLCISKSLCDPTIFEFKFGEDFKLTLNNFLRKGIVTIFWGDQKDRGNSKIQEFRANSSPVSLVHSYKKGSYKILIFAANDKTKLSSKSFKENAEKGTSNFMINFIKVGKGLTDLSMFFDGKEKFDINLNHLDVSEVTSMKCMFSGVGDFDRQIGDWNVSNVKCMRGIFYEASSFNQPIEDWDVSKVTDMGSMFCSASSFNQPIDRWNVSNVIDMKFMFCGALSFNQPIRNWDVSNVTDMRSMFYSAESFDQPIGDWNVSNVRSMSYMFHHAEHFNQPIGNWDVSNVTDIDGMFC